MIISNDHTLPEFYRSFSVEILYISLEYCGKFGLKALIKIGILLSASVLPRNASDAEAGSEYRLQNHK